MMRANADIARDCGAAPLDDYRKKRDPARTPEPFGPPRADEGRLFVVQKHAARRLHYDEQYVLCRLTWLSRLCSS